MTASAFTAETAVFAPLSMIGEVQADLKARGIDFTKKGHRYSWQYYGEVALTMGVDLTHDDLTHWVATHGVMQDLDTLLDENGGVDAFVPAVLQVAAGQPFHGVTQVEATVFSEVFDKYSKDRKKDFIKSISLLPTFAQKKKDATSVQELCVALSAEADRYASLLKTPPSNENESELQARARHNAWIESFSRAGYLVDMVLDMKKDHKAAKLSLTPSLANKKELVAEASRECMRFVRQTPLSKLPTFVGYAGKWVLHG